MLYWKENDKELGRVCTFLAEIYIAEVIDISRVKALLLKLMSHPSQHFPAQS